jgi:chromosome segregation ATPase
MQAKYDALKEEYSTYSSILRETEESLNRVSVERNLCLTQLTELRKEMERCYQEKVRLEDEILEKMRQQLTADKATQYTERLLRRLRERTKELENQVRKTFSNLLLVVLH